jgi:glycosyltransferase involved in cell wall biosynthesis
MFLSIGLPAYKSQYLEVAIQSILDQTYSNFELIIINDSSPDPVEAIVKKFNDPRISYFVNEQNFGKENLVSCWNLVLKKARGEYFVLASDDDYYESIFLERLITKANQFPEINVIHCRLRLINDIGETTDISSICNDYEDVLDFMWNRIIKKRNQMVTEFMFKTTALLDIGGFYPMPAGWSTDDITCYLLAKEKGVVFVNEILCNWRSSGENISSSHNYYSKKLEALGKYKIWIQEFLKSMESDNINNPIFSELRAKAVREIEIGIVEIAARFIFFDRPLRIFSNLRICRRDFDIKARNIIGALLESYGKKLKSRIRI